MAINKLEDNIENLEFNSEEEISLYDIVNFFLEGWKTILAAAAIGAVLGFSAWQFLGQYQAEMVLHNNVISLVTENSAKENQQNYALDLVSWRTIQKSLPNLADQLVEESRVPEGKTGLYKQMSDGVWWQKNVLPTYAITKADTKDFAAISKDLDIASTTILSLTIKASGSSKDASLENVRSAVQFLLKGGAFLQLKALLNGYESETIGTVAEIQSKITNTQIELGYLKTRAKNLEELLRRFPSTGNNGQQVVDPKESSAKYLPIPTQLVAVNTDINSNKESLERLNDRLAQIGLMKRFLEEAVPLAGNNADGVMLVREFLAIEAKLRAQLPASDVKAQQSLDGLRSQLLAIEARFTKGLEANTAPNTQKTGMLKAIAGGLAGAGFLAVLFLLARRLWSSIKSKQLTTQG